MIQKTILYNEHLKLNAKMVEFAGWNMPIQYTSIIDEHKTVRNNVGLFDVSHMGEFIIEGNDALKLINSLVPQQLKNLYIGKAIYCQLTNKDGGIIDDLIIYRLDEMKYLIIVNASRIKEDFDWINQNINNEYELEFYNISNEYSLLALQGPKTKEMFAKISNEELPKFFHIKNINIFETETLISRTGYTGEDGIEILVKNEFAVKIWNELLNIGKEFDIKPIGLGARDTLRLEAGLHLYGNDLNINTTPVEASLAWSINQDKEEDYNGKNTIIKQIKNGVEKKLVGFKMLCKNIARHDYIVYHNNKQIGNVTSGSISPMRGDNIGMAYITNVNLKEGDKIQISIRANLYDAEIVKLPFVKKNNK